jgi:hypothetical protein
LKSAWAVNLRNLKYKFLNYTVADVRIESICNEIFNVNICDYSEIILRSYVAGVLFISSYITKFRCFEDNSEAQKFRSVWVESVAQ